MPGFGSSLRMARRAGWEKAYLDYETLKLLLSQIEAVYEEEWHRQQQEEGRDDVPQTRNIKRGRHKHYHHNIQDYRDFLFLESDSDVAFASEAELWRNFTDEDDYSTDDEQQQHSKEGAMLSSHPFTMSFSQEETASSGADDDEDHENCGAGVISAWRRESKGPAVVERPARRPRPSKRHRNVILSPRRDEEFFVGDNVATSSSLLNTPLHQGWSSEATALLQQPDEEGGNSFYSFGNKALTPPTDFSGNVFYPNPSMNVNQSTTAIQQQRIPPTKQSKLEQERRRKRRQRRRRKQAKRRRELERRVPQHLRLAHAKARSITERFLGLLRAEVEKVTLFAQSRLGELADTAGSLRFPSCDDSEFGSFSNRPRPRGGGYDHPLSDGGMHPSASSSDDEHGGGIFPWSDSSDDESDDGSRPGASPRFGGRDGRRTYSPGNVSSTTDQISNLAAKRDGGSGTREGHHQRNEHHRPTRSTSSSFDAAQRQISHFTAIRCEKPTFQRNDHIVGEDLLLLSAVDEVDGFTAVGVELMHVLRFISVNVIAVRKICRKHDRLLMNRMLGGYYHRKHKEMKSSDSREARKQQKQSLTLGTVLSRSLGEEGEVDPSSLTGKNQNKLVGVYDLKVQELANAPTVKVISSCLALALSEYEVTQSRADALSKLNSVTSREETPQRSGAGGFFGSGLSPPSTAPFGLSPSRWLPSKAKPEELSPAYESLGVETPYDSNLDSDEEENQGPPSTASSISLTRLRFTVVSIFALRESARFKLDYHKIFLCRSMLSCNGPNIVGEGLDGCSRDVLDFLIAYNPDSALLLDSSTLYKGLQEGKWRKVPIGKVMLSCLSMAVSSPMMFANTSMDVQNAVSITPNLAVEMPFLSPSENGAAEFEGVTGNGFNEALLKLSRASCLLYSMNDYIIHATANSFVRFTGAHPAYSANIIGATSFAALFATGLHCHKLSSESLSKDASAVTLRVVFVLAAVAAILGNAIYIVGVSKQSIAIAVVGRLLVGLASSDLIHRQILTDCLPSIYIVPESARLVKWRVFGRVWGLLLGSVLGSFNLRVSKTLTIGAFQSSSYLMAFLWTVHAFRLFFMMPESVEANGQDKSLGHYDDEAPTIPFDRMNSQSEEFSSDESETERGTPESVLYPSSDATRDELKETFTAEKARVRLDDLSQHVVDDRRSFRRIRTLMKRLRKFLMYNIALPITLALVVLTKFTHEIFFTSCPIITYRYFKWSGSVAALFLGVLSASAVVINYVCGTSTKTYDERSVIKRALPLVFAGLLVMINYASLFSLAAQVENLLDEEDESTYVEVHPYDGALGIFQYMIGVSIVYTGTIALEGASLSLMSNVSPSSRLKHIIINCGTIVTFAGLAARVLGDVQILFVGLSHRLINTDIVNSLVIPLLIACTAAYYIVKKHFFFLM